MKTLSHSSLKLWRNCPREFFLAYQLLRRVRKTPPALAFGKLWDRALVEWHHETEPTKRLLRAAAILDAERDDWYRNKALAMLVGYTARWSDQPVELVATQVEFTVPILHPDSGIAHPEYQYTGVIDAIVRYEGRLLALESKTSGEDITPAAAFWQRIVALDAQVSMYLLGGAQAGYDLEGCLYDVARKSDLKGRKGETPEKLRERIALDIQARPDWYYQRREVVRLEHEARAYQQDLWDYACTLSEAEKLQRWPRNPDRCRQYGRPCDYLAVCMGEADINDPVLFRTVERGRHDERSRQDPKRSAA